MQSHGGVAPIAESSARRRRRRAVGARGRRGRRHLCRPPARRAQPDHLRHGGHQHGYRPACRTARRSSPAKSGSASRRSRSPRSTSTRWAPAGAPSPAWPGRSCTSDPESAGADPGPACYGKGGTAATVTDANVVLGFLDPANFLGGRIAPRCRRGAGGGRRDRAASSARAPSRPRKASPRSSTPTWRRASASSPSGAGWIPRRFTLVAFGGAAGLHVTEVARLLEIRRVVVPNVAAVLSAWGMLATDLRYEMVRSHVSEAARMTPAGLRQILAAHGGRGPRAAHRLLGRDRGAALARHALRRADLRDQRAHRRGRSVRRRTRSTRWSRASTGATRSCTPTARRARRSSSSTRGWP